MRNAGRLKLGYYPLPIDEAWNIRSLLVSSAPYAAIDPCVGDGTALIEITKDTGGHLTGIELDDETLQSRKIVDEVSTMIKENPENAASLVKRWMSKGK